MGVRAGRVMADNGPGYRSGEFNALLESEGARHIYTKPFSPWQNGKVERRTARWPRNGSTPGRGQRGGQGARPARLHRTL